MKSSRIVRGWVRGLAVLLMLSAGLLKGQEPDSQAGEDLLPQPEWSSWFESEEGAFRVRYRSELGAISINEMHNWDIQIEDAQRSAVADAEFEVSGGMPEHDHGLATSPEVEPTSEPGLYRLTGLRFHMPGQWELELAVRAGHNEDDITISLRL